MKRAVKRSVSIMLSVLMILSMCVMGVFTGTAATTDENASGVSFDGTSKIYLDSNGCSWWNNANAIMGVQFKNAQGVTTDRVVMTAVEGQTKFFEATVPAGDYTKAVFTRSETEAGAAWNQFEVAIPADIASKNVFQINSNATGGAWTDSYTPPTYEYGPKTIYFDNTNTKWSKVYIYGWSFGLGNAFTEMKLVEGNIYTYTFSEDPIAGQEGYLFANSPDWDQQTLNVASEKDKNFYTSLGGGGKAWKGTWDVYTPAEPTDPPTEEPTVEPTDPPTEEPTVEPTALPTEEPTVKPTDPPTEEPTAEPTAPPTEEPTVQPTEPPTEQPTETPTEAPHTYTTIYFCPQQAWLDAGYSVRINACTSKDKNTWIQVDMTATGETVNGQPSYMGVIDNAVVPWGGFDKMQLQALDNGNWKAQVVAFDAWKTLDSINGKFYSSSTADKADWVDYVPDAEPATYTVTFMDDQGNVLGESVVEEGGTATAPALPTMKDKEYVAQFSPEELANITADKTLTYKLEAKTHTVTLAAPDETVTMTGGTEGIFAYGETVTLISSADNFAYWAVNGKIVSYDKAFSYIVTADLVVEAVKSDQPVVKEPAVSIDSPIFDTATDPGKILMYFGVNAINQGDAPRYGVFRFVGEAPADAAAAIQDYLDNGSSSVYNGNIKEYTDSGVMNSDGRYNYVASAPVGVSADKTMTVYAFIVVDGVLYISDAVTAAPGAQS